MNPQVSVIINCYNGSQYLECAIKSVLNQTYSNFELIIWDNVSNDNSESVVKLFSDDRIKYFKSDTHDILGKARNRALNMAYGEYIAFLDCDDFWYPDKLEIQVSQMSSGNYIMAYAGVNILNESDSIIQKLVPVYSTGNVFENLLNYFDINMATPILKRDSLLNLNLNFDPFIYASEEVNLFLKLAYFGDIYVSKEILAGVRQRNNSLTQNSIKYWHSDLQITIEQLLLIDPMLPNKYNKSFNNIMSKFYYYKSRSYLNSFQYFKSLNSAILAVKLNKKYFLFLITFVLPFLPNLIVFLYEKKKLRWFLNLHSIK